MNLLTNLKPAIKTGKVIYLEVFGMGKGKKRPCIIFKKSHSKALLVPLSSKTLNPTNNPSVYFKGDISFAILDKAFYKCIENYRPTKLEVSQGAVADCLRFMNTF